MRKARASNSAIRPIINFVDECLVFGGFFDDAVKTYQQLLKCFASTANQDCQALIIISRSGGAAYGGDSADRDLAITINQVFDVSTLEIIFCAFRRKLFREGTYLVVYPG